MASAWRRNVSLRVKKYLNEISFALPATAARDDHPLCVGHLACELRGQEVLRFVGLGAGRTEDGDLALGRVRREEPERVPQFAHRALDQLDVAAVLDVFEQFDRVVDNVGDQIGVVPTAL